MIEYGRSREKIDTQTIAPEIIASNLHHLSEFDAGVRYAINKIQTRLFYIPDEWKEGDALTLFNIIYNCCMDLEGQFVRDEEDY